jgi:hypothetical protein
MLVSLELHFMSRLEDVLPAFRQGKKIKRPNGLCFDLYSSFSPARSDLLADDWEIVEDKPVYLHGFEPITVWGLNSKQILELKEFYLKHKGELPNE